MASGQNGQGRPGIDDFLPDQKTGSQRSPPPTFDGTQRPFANRTPSNVTSQPPLNSAGSVLSPQPSEGALSPGATDRVFPIRSVVSVDPTPTPYVRSERAEGSYFPTNTRRQSANYAETPARANRRTSEDRASSPPSANGRLNRQRVEATNFEPSGPRPAQQQLADVIRDNDSISSERAGTSGPSSERRRSSYTPSVKSVKSVRSEGGEGIVTARFKHVVSEGGHAVITGRDGDTIQRCEDEPIHIPGAVQGFGLLIALEEQDEGRLVVRIVTENSKQILGYTPKQLFALDSFTDILSEEQADNLLDHVDFIRDDDADVVTNGPEVFTLTVRCPHRKNQKFWCAMHISESHENLIICEFELEDDPVNPLVAPSDQTPEPPEDTLDSQPTDEEYQESTQNTSKPLRVLRSARKRKGEAAAMEVFNIMSQVQEQLASAPNLEKFLKILVGVVKELTGFHRVMIYQFDQNWNGRVVTELVDPRATKDLYKGLNFPASDIPKQARDLYKINKVRMLYDRDQETARLVCRTVEDLERPLDLTHSYLRAMSPIHLKYLANMAVRSSMSISINAFDELWGLIALHSYGSRGMRVSFPIRKMCRLVGDSASRNIERLSYASRLQARKLINTVPTSANPSGYIIASSEDLLKLFDADFGLLSIRDETKILGNLEQSHEALAMLEYLRLRKVSSVLTSMDIREDFPDLRYPPGFQVIAGLLLVPLSVSGTDFIVFFRKGQLKEVKWAGNPYEKFIREGTEGYLEPRKSFRTWSETVVGKCRDWTEEEIETAAVLCLVYGKFIEVWRQKEAALQNSQLTRLLLANSAHEVRTPLNAIINYLEIALEGSLDQETRDNLAKSHSASKSLVYVINDLLDLTKTEEGGDLVKDEVFELRATLVEATDMFKGDAKRKNIEYEIVDMPGLPVSVVGDQRRVRQAISNVTANAIQFTNSGSVKVEMYLARREEQRCEIEISVTDTGCGMDSKQLDDLFRELEQVQTEEHAPSAQNVLPDMNALPDPAKPQVPRTLGLGLAVVARIIRNMNGQLRLKSEEGKGSRFVMQFPFDLPEAESTPHAIEPASSAGSITPHGSIAAPMTPPVEGEVTLIERMESSSSVKKQLSGDSKMVPHMSRQNSTDSVGSKHSVASMKSARSNLSYSSAKSGRSEADRLIEAIQEPHRVEGWHENNVQKANAVTPRAGSSHGPSGTFPGGTTTGAPAILRPANERVYSYEHNASGVVSSPNSRQRTKSVEFAADRELRKAPSDPGPLILEAETRRERPGESLVMDSGVPIRSIRLHEDAVDFVNGEQLYATSKSSPRASIAPRSRPSSSSTSPPRTDTAENLRVLVAEDDPVNSRIIQKRLSKLGHEVSLTVNGEECSSAYGDKSGSFDIVLMDMQMPIVDGLTSTKMIRSFEKTHPNYQQSPRAALNKRVPIIAVSASLLEKDRQTYVDAGFDGWILKPIAFGRLSEIMKGLVDNETRSNMLYKPGRWEHGGWFNEPHDDAFHADTRPSDHAPMTGASKKVENALTSRSPFVKEENESRQSVEQNRLARTQEEHRSEDTDDREAGSSEETITAAQQVTSPEPIE